MVRIALVLLGVLSVFVFSGCATTSLYQAATLNDIAGVQGMITGGTPVDSVDVSQCTPLMGAAMRGHTELARLLVEKGANVNYVNPSGDTPLIWAAAGGKIEIFTLLIEKGGNVNAASKNGNTPLIMAAKYGNPEIAKLLYEKGANVNSVNGNGDTPLTIAAKYGKAVVAKFLIEKGADLNHASNVGTPPIPPDYFKLAVATEPVKVIWENMNIESNNGSTPLIMAASHGFTETALVLITNGADPYVRGKDGRNALDWAKKRNHVEIYSAIEANETAKKTASRAKLVDEFETLIAGNDSTALRAYLDKHPDALPSIKNTELRLSYTGPVELRVIDIAQMVKEGNNGALIIAQINSVGGPYKKFTVGEIAALKKMKLPDEIVAAMIAVTTAYNKEQKLISEQKRTQTVQAPVQVVQQTQQSVQPQQTPQANTLPECLKLAAALKACDQAGGFLSMGCKAVARSQFNCPSI